MTFCSMVFLMVNNWIGEKKKIRLQDIPVRGRKIVHQQLR